MAKTKKLGRPTTYNVDIAIAICKRMEKGECLNQICKNADMPYRSTVMDWTRANEAFNSMYVRARAELWEHWAEEITTIADDSSNDWLEREVEAGRVNQIMPHNDHISRSRLRIDARKWLLSKLLPKRFGDVTEVNINHRRAADLTDAELSDIASGSSPRTPAAPSGENEPSGIH